MKYKDEVHLAEVVRDLGGMLWSVGGQMRDALMGVTAHDNDFMITGVAVHKMPFARVAGKDFPVFLVPMASTMCEVAMARTETKQGTGHKGFVFFTDETVTIEQDLARRDLTINAMARNVLTGEVVDPFNGQGDLQRKVLRHVTASFSEDPLRVLRVARFAAQLGFSVAPETLELMRSLVLELPTLSSERVWQETERALATPKPSRFFSVLQDVGALATLFPEVQALEVPDKHDGTTLKHTMRVIDTGRSALERFGLLVHDFGKGVTPKSLHPTHHGHDRLGRKVVLGFCRRLTVSRAFTTFGMLCATEHMRVKFALEMRPGRFLRWALQLKASGHFEGVVQVSYLDSTHREDCAIDEVQRQFKVIRDLADMAFAVEREVTGAVLLDEGKEPGKRFGQLLLQRRAEEFQRRTSGIYAQLKASQK